MSYGLDKDSILMMLKQGILKISVEDGTGRVFRNGRELSARENKRKRCKTGDFRVDIWYKGERVSINVSHLVWMQSTLRLIPIGWEIHHVDGNIYNNNFDNLMCLHPLDHSKLHNKEEVPF